MTERVREEESEEKIWTQEEGSNRRLGKKLHEEKLHNLLFTKYYKGNKIKKVGMDEECSTYETVIIFIGRCDEERPNRRWVEK